MGSFLSFDEDQRAPRWRRSGAERVAGASGRRGAAGSGAADVDLEPEGRPAEDETFSMVETSTTSLRAPNMHFGSKFLVASTSMGKKRRRSRR